MDERNPPDFSKATSMEELTNLVNSQMQSFEQRLTGLELITQELASEVFESQDYSEIDKSLSPEELEELPY